MTNYMTQSRLDRFNKVKAEAERETAEGIKEDLHYHQRYLDDNYGGSEEAYHDDYVLQHGGFDGYFYTPNYSEPNPDRDIPYMDYAEAKAVTELLGSRVGIDVEMPNGYPSSRFDGWDVDGVSEYSKFNDLTADLNEEEKSVLYDQLSFEVHNGLKLDYNESYEMDDSDFADFSSENVSIEHDPHDWDKDLVDMKVGIDMNTAAEIEGKRAAFLKLAGGKGEKYVSKENAYRNAALDREYDVEYDKDKKLYKVLDPNNQVVGGAKDERKAFEQTKYLDKARETSHEMSREYIRSMQKLDSNVPVSMNKIFSNSLQKNLGREFE